MGAVVAADAEDLAGLQRRAQLNARQWPPQGGVFRARGEGEGTRDGNHRCLAGLQQRQHGGWQGRQAQCGHRGGQRYDLVADDGAQGVGALGLVGCQLHAANAA